MSNYSLFPTNSPSVDYTKSHSFTPSREEYYLSHQRDPIIGTQTKRCTFTEEHDKWSMSSSLPIKIDIPKKAANYINWPGVSENQDQGHTLWKYSIGYLPTFLEISNDLRIVDEILDSLWEYTQSDDWSDRAKWMTSLDHALAIRIRAITTLQAQYSSLGQPLPHSAWKVLLNDISNIMDSGDHYFPLNNHGAMVAISLLHAGSIFPQIDKMLTIDLKKSILQVGWEQLNRIIDSIFDEYGIAGENSPEYQRYWISLLTPISSLLETWRVEEEASSFTQEKLLTFKPLLEKATRALTAFTTDEGRLIAIGDTHPRLLKSSTYASEALVSVKQGFGIYREGPTHLTFNCGNTNYAHKHCDDSSITLTRHGERLILDSGYYSHDWKDPKAIFTKSQNAHSGVFLRKLDSLHPGQLYWPNKERVVGKLTSDSIDHFNARGTVSIDNQFLIEREVSVPRPDVIRITDYIEGNYQEGGEAVRRFIFPLGAEIDLQHERLIITGEKSKLQLIFGSPWNLQNVSIRAGSVNPYYGWISEEIEELSPAYCVDVPLPYFKKEEILLVLSDV